MSIAQNSDLETIPDGLLVICVQNGYLFPKVLPDGRWAAVMPLLFTGAIITMTRHHRHLCYDDRWCYANIQMAKLHLEQWSGDGEPRGWHRHPGTGRRRPEGDPLQEYINR